MIVYGYVVGLHTSMALMELFGWLTVVTGLVCGYRGQGHRFRDFLCGHMCTHFSLLALVVWVGVSLLSTPLEKAFWAQFGFMRWTVLLVGLAYALKVFWKDSFEKYLIWVWSGVFVVTGLYAALQFFTGIDFVRPGRGVVDPQAGGLFKAVGFFSMSLTFAYVIGLSTFAVLPRLGAEWGGRVKWLAGLLGAFALLSSMSRGAWISAILCLGLYLACVRRKLFVLFVLAVGVGVFGVAQLDDAVGRKVSDLVNLRVDHSSQVRLDLWRAYGQMFLDHPIFGVGIFEGDRLLPEYYLRLGIDQKFASHAHNVYLQWLAGTGAPGLLLYLVLVWTFLGRAWRIRLVDPWGWGLFLAQVFVHLGALTEANFFDGEVNHMLVFVWALTWVRGEKT